jgi:uncharacterized protein YPO0396
MLEMRRDIAAAIGISESALPFVGELVEVKPDEAEWQGPSSAYYTDLRSHSW